MKRLMFRGSVLGDKGTFIGILFTTAIGNESKLFPMFLFLLLADVIFPSHKVQKPTHTQTYTHKYGLVEYCMRVVHGPAYCCLSSSLFNLYFQKLRLCRQYSCRSFNAASVSTLPWFSYSSSVSSFFFTCLLNKRRSGLKQKNTVQNL